ncbi:hypothetical protein [Halobacteriovorax sp. HLS]|uniref:hypothetical protein n=1 Tax=Halobacteriovorax sp. HLS TaxID=2234000 RepID=UPI000FDA4958|nr:hypothetical protein [Halobacteriovorax sp. HLS]
MKFFSILLLLLMISCTKEEFNNQYNLPGSSETTTSQEVQEVLLEKNVRTLEFLGDLSIPAYSSKVKEEFFYERKKATCKLTYKMSNFDVNIKKGFQLPILSEEIRLTRDFTSSDRSVIEYSISFDENDFKINYLICSFENGKDLFLNRDLLTTFKEIMKKVSLFNSQNEQFIF